MPRSIHPVLAALLATSTVVTAALGWFGWRYIDQQAAVERQRARERIETAADAVAARVAGALAEAAERLSGWVSNPGAVAPLVDGAAVFASSEERVELQPPHSLPFIPQLRTAAVLSGPFAVADALELNPKRQADAVEAYRKLSRSADATVRAEGTGAPWARHQESR